jgi:pimeloyl-ACP methyl ester carboxylesterase
LDTVVEYIKQLRGVKKVALVSWSRGSLVAGPYAVQHPEKVESLFLLAPIFNPKAVPGLPYAGPSAPPGFAAPVKLATDARGKVTVIACTRPDVTNGVCPGVTDRKLEVPENAANPTMTLTPRNNIVDAQGKLILEGMMGRWDRELQCENQIDDAIQDVVWNTAMDNDELGRTWGAPPAGAPDGSSPQGVLRVRSFVPWGWGAETASNVRVPVLIIFGDLDTEGRAEGFPVAVNSFLLYDTIPERHKLLFKVGCTGHFMPWERQAKVLHHISKQWLKHGAVEEFTSGRFLIDTEGNLLPMDDGKRPE